MRALIGAVLLAALLCDEVGHSQQPPQAQAKKQSEGRATEGVRANANQYPAAQRGATAPQRAAERSGEGRPRSVEPSEFYALGDLRLKVTDALVVWWAWTAVPSHECRGGIRGFYDSGKIPIFAHPVIECQTTRLSVTSVRSFASVHASIHGRFRIG
jgi:hypothetical protein